MTLKHKIGATTPGRHRAAVLDEFIRARTLGAEALQMLFPTLPTPRPLDEFFPSPLAITPRRSGKISVTHTTLTESTPIIGARQAVLRGIQRVDFGLRGGPLRIHELRDGNHGVWMTDLPEELHQIAEMIHTVKPAGHVLVGGLGLGILVHRLYALSEVERITVVERSRDVINLIAPTLLRTGAKIVHSDIRTYLRRSRQAFDCFLLDTWQGTSESTWWNEVAPLKRIIRRRWGHGVPVHCWAEDIMAGQVLTKLVGPDRNWYYEKLPPRMSVEDAAHFFDRVGAGDWEERWGSLVRMRP